MIRLDDVSVQLRGRVVIDRVGLSVGAGELVCLLGPNGAGKSTLLRATAGLLPAAGRIEIGGRSIREMTAGERARTVAYLPQGHVAHWPIRAAEAVAIGRMPHGGGPGRRTAADAAAIARALAAVDATGLADRPVTELSGGERARVMLARALAVEASALVADEPIAALDPAHQIEVMALLVRIAGEGRSVVAALHEVTLAARFASRIVVLDRGRVVAAGRPAEVLSPRLLAAVFGIEALRLEHGGSPVIVPWARDADLRT